MGTPGWLGEDAVEFSVLASYALTGLQTSAKLAEFPRGSQVSWQIWQPGTISSTVTMMRQKTEYETMRAFAVKSRMTLVKYISAYPRHPGLPPPLAGCFTVVVGGNVPITPTLPATRQLLFEY